MRPKLSPRSESRTKKRPPKDNTSKELKITKVLPKVSFGGLSSKADARDEAYRLLLRFGIHTKVADSIVYSQKHPPESIENAIKNALARKAWLKLTDPLRADLFKVPGYVVMALNMARKELHTVGPSGRSVSIEKLRRPREPLSQSEFEKQRRVQVRKLLAG